MIGDGPCRSSRIRRKPRLTFKSTELGFPMKAEYDFSKAKRGAVVPQSSKTRITMYLDDATLEEFRHRAYAAGKGYQTMINDALREYLAKDSRNLEETLRRIIREEMGQTA